MTDTRHVQATFDPDAGVWWAESDDLPGLVSEAPTLDALVERVAAVVPELLAVSGAMAAPVELVFTVTPQVEPA